MILWITGQSRSGKTTLAKKLATGHNVVMLDGNSLREVWTDLGMEKNDRWDHNLRVARLARTLESQGMTVIVSVICPYRELRKQVQDICGCVFIYVEGGLGTDFEHPYEIPEHPTLVLKR